MNESVNFEFSINNGIAIFKLNESRFDAAIAGLVKAEFTISLSEEVNKLIVDMSQVEYCDSSGLSALLLAFRILQAEEGKIKIASPQKSVKTLIEISQLDKILPIYNSVEEAIKEFNNN
ncbi:MAG: anti-anti-sigma factor [Ignavibacteriales bacterium CG18_big_fil_WC_8_21_14_2_50_31_20]|nr:MAG: anti-anti-sigma factor [Ignavibacteriales bacterium CG18_big_fil_WC_8_21_14_2_50_31_20]